jgi:hypothetical protein
MNTIKRVKILITLGILANTLCITPIWAQPNNTKSDTVDSAASQMNDYDIDGDDDEDDMYRDDDEDDMYRDDDEDDMDRDDDEDEDYLYDDNSGLNVGIPSAESETMRIAPAQKTGAAGASLPAN